MSCSKATDQFKTLGGTTLCADDFYEAQGRVDGAFCSYTEEEKMQWLKMVYERGVRNIEMESACFSAMLQRANIRGK